MDSETDMVVVLVKGGIVTHEWIAVAVLLSGGVGLCLVVESIIVTHDGIAVVVLLCEDVVVVLVEEGTITDDGVIVSLAVLLRAQDLDEGVFISPARKKYDFWEQSLIEL